MSGTSTGVADTSEVAYPPRVRRRKSPPLESCCRCCRGGWAKGEAGVEAAAATAASCASTAVMLDVGWSGGSVAFDRAMRWGGRGQPFNARTGEGLAQQDTLIYALPYQLSGAS